MHGRFKARTAYLPKERSKWFKRMIARRRVIKKAIRRGVRVHRLTFVAGDQEAADHVGEEDTGVEGSGLSLNCSMLTRYGS